MKHKPFTRILSLLLAVATLVSLLTFPARAAKITKVCREIHAMKRMDNTSDRVAQIQRINAMIMGIAEYIKISICSKAFSVLDHRIYVSCHYTWEDLRMSAYKNSIYNFEYFMNREYAFNRDKWKCRCCGAALTTRKGRHCHHVNRRLPLDKINRVPNLAWVCQDCHQRIHSFYAPVNIDEKTRRKILKFREKLDQMKSTSE